jgi:type IX secretion system PorP/SprF family membrane protein
MKFTLFLHKYKIAAFLLISTTFFAYGQDPVLTQYYASPIQLSPAFAGVAEAPYFTLYYRNQWHALNNAYSTYGVTYDHYSPQYKSGIGLSIQADDAGDGIYKRYYAHVNYSYEVQFNKKLKAKLGANLGLIQSRLDWNKLIFYDQLNPQFGVVDVNGNSIPSREIRPDNLTNNMLDIGAGILIYSPQFYAGLSLLHLNTPTEGFQATINGNLKQGLPMRMMLFGGTDIVIDRGNKNRLPTYFSPALLIAKQAGIWQINMGTNLSMDKVYGGLWYRHTPQNSDAIIGTLGMIFDYIKIGYSYDFTVSSLINKSGNSHEITMRINLDPNASKRINYNNCFKLFH